MLVRYRMTASATFSNVVADVRNIINGAATSLSQLTAAADQTNTVFYGTYPNGTFSNANVVSNTYSKTHSVISGNVHYFRLGWDNATQKLANITLAQTYTSGSDTLLNTVTTTTNVGLLNYSATGLGIDIIVSPQMIYVGQGGASQFGIFDIGHNGVTRTYTGSMLMLAQNMFSTINYGTNLGGVIPYTWIFDTETYGSSTNSIFSQTPLRKVNETGNLAIFENPSFTTGNTTGSTTNVIYGLYKLPSNGFAGVQTYVDSNGLRRLTVNDFSLLTY